MAEVWQLRPSATPENVTIQFSKDTKRAFAENWIKWWDEKTIPEEHLPLHVNCLRELRLFHLQKVTSEEVIISSDLKGLFEEYARDATWFGSIQFTPSRDSDQNYWLLRVTHEVDAVIPELSDVRGKFRNGEKTDLTGYVWTSGYRNVTFRKSVVEGLHLWRDVNLQGAAGGIYASGELVSEMSRRELGPFKATKKSVK